MASYRFKALNASGNIVEADIAAASEEEALVSISKSGLTTFHIEARTVSNTRAGLLRWREAGSDWRAQFYQRLSLLLGAGVPLERAFRILASQATLHWEKALFISCSKGLASGDNLPKALKQSHPSFSEFEMAILQVGERTGNYARVLEELAQNLENRTGLRNRIVSALVYPAFLMLLAPASLILISTVLVPNIAPLFEGSAVPAPFAVRAMVFSHGAVANHPVQTMVACLAALAIAIWLLSRSPLHHVPMSLLLRLPVLGTIMKLLTSAHVCRVLASMLRGGAPLQECMAAVEKTAWNQLLLEQISLARRAVNSGQSLAAAMAAQHLLYHGTVEMIAVGEETNRLEQVLTFAASAQEKQAFAIIERLMTLLVPLLTVLIGLLIGGIIVSVMQALLTINQMAVG